MLLQEGLTRVHSQKDPRLHFGESFKQWCPTNQQNACWRRMFLYDILNLYTSSCHNLDLFRLFSGQIMFSPKTPDSVSANKTERKIEFRFSDLLLLLLWIRYGNRWSQKNHRDNRFFCKSMLARIQALAVEEWKFPLFQCLIAGSIYLYIHFSYW